MIRFFWMLLGFAFLSPVWFSPSVQASDVFAEQIRIYDRDDIHAIHKRLFTKQGRHEISANFGGIFNNNGYFLTTLTYQYHIFEALGLEAAAGGFGFQTSDDERMMFYQASASFAPIYGKVSWFTWAVLNFDLYVIGGAGVVNYQGLVDDTAFMGNVGLGTRLFINEYLSAKIEFRDYIFNRKLPVGDSEVQHNYSLTAGIAILIPFKQGL